MAGAKKSSTPKAKPSERRAGAADGEPKGTSAAPATSNRDQASRDGRNGSLAVPASGGLASVLASHLNEPWRSLALAVIPFLTFWGERHREEFRDWIFGELRSLYRRHRAAGACKGIKKLTAELRRRLEHQDLDPGIREDISDKIIQLERSLTAELIKANVRDS